MTDKIVLLIFSFDRPAQMDLLLRSIEKKAPNEFEISILYRYSNKDFRAGYQLLREQYEENVDVEFWNEKNDRRFNDYGDSFKDKVLRMMGYYEGYQLLSMMTDDCLMYRSSPLNDLKDALTNYPDKVGVVNLRIGMDTSVDCYYDGKPLPHLVCGELTPSTFYWRHSSYPPNSAYQYVNTLDGGIWRYADILDLVKNTDFKNPNTLESGLSNKTGWLKPLCVVGNHQSVVAIPINSVAGWNRSGSYFPRDTKELNDKFLQGKRLDLDKAISYSMEHVKSTHWEIPFQFCERSEQ